MKEDLKLAAESEIERLLQKLNDNYLDAKVNIYDVDLLISKKIKALFINIIESIISSEIEDEQTRGFIYQSFQELAKVYIDNHIPYVVLINEINFVQNNLMHLTIKHRSPQEALELFKLFDELETYTTDNYLKNYLVMLKKYNENRLVALNRTLRDEIIRYFKAHIIWLNDLVDAIVEKDISKVPEIHHHRCAFGKWLDSKEVHDLIGNDEDYLKLYKDHKQLHMVGTQVLNLLQGDIQDFHACLTYVQRAENLSKHIGEDLTIISNRLTVKMANKDPLTGVLNRSLLNELFRKQYEISLATQNSFILAMCDLDYFKTVNDTYGHLVGDKVLKHFADLLKKRLRVSDMIIRYGGEEFLLILPTMKFAEGWKMLDQLRKELQKSILEIENNKISTTVSIGLIEVNPEDEDSCKDDLELCLKKADILLYEAKQNGRNRVEGRKN